MKSAHKNPAVKKSALIPIAVTVLCLVPFVNKAFHIDDPMYIWAAKQIRNHPLDFYGFSVNWYGIEMPMAEVNENPPGVSYYIAGAASLLGWTEPALHIAFLLPAAAVALGTYYLARQFTNRATLAALAAVLTPGFLVSSTNIMSDVPMLAFWVWAVFCWVRGIKQNQKKYLLIAGLLAALCVLTKYFGIALLLLLPAYALLKKHKPGWWTLSLLLPAGILIAFEWATAVTYGKGLLTDAASYATQFRQLENATVLSKTVTGLAFAGGCAATVLFFAPLLWRRRTLIIAAIAGAAAVAILAIVQTSGRYPIIGPEFYKWRLVLGPGSPNWPLYLQLVIMALAGISLLALPVVDLIKNRDADSAFLLLWLLGTFIFAAYVNWVANARSLLPIIPVAGIIIARRLEQTAPTVSNRRARRSGRRPVRPDRTGWALVPAAILALIVCYGDYAWADTPRRAAKLIMNRYDSPTRIVWFQGHWGFQYYMQSRRARAIDFDSSRPASGDIIVIPLNNCFTRPIPENIVTQIATLEFQPSRRVSTMSHGGSFYADMLGPVPYVFAPIQNEQYFIYTVK